MGKIIRNGMIIANSEIPTLQQVTSAGNISQDDVEVNKLVADGGVIANDDSVFYGKVSLTKDPIGPLDAATKDYVDEAVAGIRQGSMTFKGWISKYAPTGDIRVGNYWYQMDDPFDASNPNDFPWQIKTWDGASWNNSEYTASALDLWVDSNTKSADNEVTIEYYYVGSHWSRLDFSGTSFSDQFVISPTNEVSLAPDSITGNEILNGSISKFKLDLHGAIADSDISPNAEIECSKTTCGSSGGGSAGIISGNTGIKPEDCMMDMLGYRCIISIPNVEDAQLVTIYPDRVSYSAFMDMGPKPHLSYTGTGPGFIFGATAKPAYNIEFFYTIEQLTGHEPPVAYFSSFSDDKKLTKVLTSSSGAGYSQIMNYPERISTEVYDEGGSYSTIYQTKGELTANIISSTAYWSLVMDLSGINVYDRENGFSVGGLLISSNEIRLGSENKPILTSDGGSVYLKPSLDSSVAILYDKVNINLPEYKLGEYGEMNKVMTTADVYASIISGPSFYNTGSPGSVQLGTDLNSKTYRMITSISHDFTVYPGNTGVVFPLAHVDLPTTEHISGAFISIRTMNTWQDLQGHAPVAVLNKGKLIGWVTVEMSDPSYGYDVMFRCVEGPAESIDFQVKAIVTVTNSWEGWF